MFTFTHYPSTPVTEPAWSSNSVPILARPASILLVSVQCQLYCQPIFPASAGYVAGEAKRPWKPSFRLGSAQLPLQTQFQAPFGTMSPRQSHPLQPLLRHLSDSFFTSQPHFLRGRPLSATAELPSPKHQHFSSASPCWIYTKLIGSILPPLLHRNQPSWIRF